MIIAVFLLSIVIILLAYVYIDMFAYFKGAPYVPTSGKIIDEILKAANLKQGKQFIELGSGDGRVVMKAVQDYKVFGVGIEFHPYLVIYSKIVASLKGINNIKFIRQNFYQADLSKADYIFLFLLPETLKKLKTKLEKESKKGTLIISHGFKVSGLEKKLVKTIPRKNFPTYFYQL